LQDERFSVRQTAPNDWSLAIKYVKKRDQGVYVCQVGVHGDSPVLKHKEKVRRDQEQKSDFPPGDSETGDTARLPAQVAGRAVGKIIILYWAD
jgi:hypothetical protein